MRLSHSEPGLGGNGQVSPWSGTHSSEVSLPCKPSIALSRPPVSPLCSPSQQAFPNRGLLSFGDWTASDTAFLTASPLCTADRVMHILSVLGCGALSLVLYCSILKTALRKDHTAQMAALSTRMPLGVAPLFAVLKVNPRKFLWSSGPSLAAYPLTQRADSESTKGQRKQAGHPPTEFHKPLKPGNH